MNTLKLHIKFIIILSVIISCNNNEDIQGIKYKLTGKATITVTDELGEPLPDNYVRIYSVEAKTEIFSDSTNLNGEVATDELIQGNYYYFVKDTVGSKIYESGDYFQVFADEDTRLTTCPYLNTVDVVIKLYTDRWGSNEYLDSFNVLLVDDYYAFHFEEILIEKSVYRGITDSLGSISFQDVPASWSYHKYGRYYYVYVYNSEYFGIANDFYIQRERDDTLNLWVFLKERTE